MTTRFISLPGIVLLALLAFAGAAQADTCLSSGILVDANNQTIGVCQPSGSGAAQAIPSNPGNGGIFSCSAPGATSVAASSAIGGTFVPVYDAAVALNTGTLTYKECVLKELANQQKQAVTVSYVQQEYNQLATGRNGNPQWVVNYAKESNGVADQAVVSTFQSGVFNTIDPAFRNQVQTAVLRNYQYQTQAPQTALTCPYQGDWAAVTGNPTQNFSWDAVFAMSNPACDPVYAYTTAEGIRDANIGAAQNQWLNQLNWGNGLYSATDNGQYNGNITVPAVFLEAAGTQALTSGFRQLENANDIGEMVGRYFTGIDSMLLSSPTSVASVQQYIGKAVQEQQNTLIGSAVNTALTNIYQIINWEQQYNDLQQKMAGTIGGAITQLRAAEATCWGLIIQNVCADTASTSAATASTTCTSKSGGTLSIATSTSFSSTVFASSNFSALAQTLAQRIDTSNQNLATLSAIEAAIQSSDPATRNTGLQQLNTIVSASPSVLHTQSNITQAQDELGQLQAAISDSQSGLVNTTIHRWAGDDSQGGTGTIGWSGDPASSAGWCNVPISGSPSSAQQQTLTNWTAAWTH